MEYLFLGFWKGIGIITICWNSLSIRMPILIFISCTKRGKENTKWNRHSIPTYSSYQTWQKDLGAEKEKEMNHWILNRNTDSQILIQNDGYLFSLKRTNNRLTKYIGDARAC